MEQTKITEEDASQVAQHSRCMRCHRALKTPRSRAIGFGPICQARVVAETIAAKEEARMNAGPVFELIVRNGVAVI